MSGNLRVCRGCGSRDRMPILDMGDQPLAEGGSDELYPLRLVQCGGCTLVQLDYAVDPELVFRKEHPYATGNSAALRGHYLRLAGDTEPAPGSVVVDIGANDGTLLGYYPGGLTRIAVEPTDQILKCAEGIIRYQEPWTWELAYHIHAKYGQARVIIACNVLAHVPDVHGFLDGVEEMLAPDGVFITENHDLHSVLDGLQVDTVYHEHLRYYSAASLSRLLEDHGLRVERIVPVNTHGGSFRTYARTAKGNFADRARQAASALHDLIRGITVDDQQEVYGVGAATRATPLIHFARIPRMISAVCEVSTSDKIGTLMPGTEIPVVDESELVKNQPEYALLFAWHMADFIIPKLRQAGYKGRFIIPLPDPKVIG